MKKIFFTLTQCLILASYAQIPTDNLEAYYPFNGNANDESVNSNNGVVMGATLVADRFGNPASAYSFDGINDYIAIDDPTWASNFEGSYSVWASFDNLSGRNHILGKQGNGSSPGPFHETIETGTLGDRFWFRAYDSDGGFPELEVDVPSVPLVVDEWYHLVFVVSATEGTSLYINGVEVVGDFGSGSAASTYWFQDFMGTNTEWQIGTTKQYFDEIDSPTDGYLDDIRIYSDALTDCEVWALYLEGMEEDLMETEEIELCEGEDYMFPDGTTQSNITEDVVYTSYFPAVLTGCDSASVETSIIVSQIDESVTQTANVLTSNAVGLSYQWINCDNAFAPIDEETNQSFTATSNGNYAVVLSNGACSDTSDCFHVTNIGFETEELPLFEIYPNPSNGMVWIDNKSTKKEFELRVLNALGQGVIDRKSFSAHTTSVDLNSLQDGVYWIVIDTEGRSTSQKLILKR
ncbi:MAG: T9SS type A sorting domain-containing protein [Flavobacteriales bacterium]|nr:T9SS type A sorting domain-containing protein [Flavobacteriales bacterium]